MSAAAATPDLRELAGRRALAALAEAERRFGGRKRVAPLVPSWRPVATLAVEHEGGSPPMEAVRDGLAPCSTANAAAAVDRSTVEWRTTYLRVLASCCQDSVIRQFDGQLVTVAEHAERIADTAVRARAQRTLTPWPSRRNDRSQPLTLDGLNVAGSRGG